MYVRNQFPYTQYAFILFPKSWSTSFPCNHSFFFFLTHFPSKWSFLPYVKEGILVAQWLIKVCCWSLQRWVVFHLLMHGDTPYQICNNTKALSCFCVCVFIFAKLFLFHMTLFQQSSAFSSVKQGEQSLSGLKKVIHNKATVTLPEIKYSYWYSAVVVFLLFFYADVL